MSEHQPEPVRILAIDGGGIGGIIPARVLAFLEQTYPALVDRADIIAGTSTGAFIALGLARKNRVTPARLVELYRTRAHEIFPSRLFSAFTSVFHAKHSPAGLSHVVSAIVEDETLGDLAKPVLVPVVAVTRPDGKHVPAGVYLSTVYKLAAARLKQARANGVHVVAKDQPAAKYQSDSWRCVDVALGTSAAPTYFPAHVIDRPSVGGRWVLWDGGLVANNPAMVAHGELSRFVHGPWPDVRILSLGTGYRDIPIEANAWGQLEAVRPVISTLLDTSVGSTAFTMRQMLEERSVRVNVNLTSDYAMDDPTVVDRLIQEVDRFCATGLGNIPQPDRMRVDLHQWLQQWWL